MVLKRLELYDIREEGGELKVWSRMNGRYLARSYNPRQGYRLAVDGRTMYFSDGHLRFLMAHPELDALTVSPRTHRISFNDDGTVKNYYPENQAAKYTCFRSLEHALETVLLLMAARDGDEAPIARFLAEQREAACYEVARLMRCGYGKARLYLEDGENIFLSQIRTARTETVRPLFAWLCKCICSAMKKGFDKISIEEHNLDVTALLVERTISD